MKEKRLEIRKGTPYPLGVTVVEDGSINVVMEAKGKESCGIILYHLKTKEEIKINFLEEHRIGNVCSIKLPKEVADLYSYNLFENDEVMIDSYAKKVTGNTIWGKDSRETIRCHMKQKSFDWQDDALPMTPYKDSIFYLLHVRGFTKHQSSKVKNKGTFEGLVEKIPYLKSLGITAIEMMPAYDFHEIEVVKDRKITMEQMVESYKENKENPKVNYWGYKTGFYFTPKNAYGAKGDGVQSFKEMVKELHRNGIEAIMQFYFPITVKKSYVIEVLKYWKQEYHVDGFRLLGENLPIEEIVTDVLFYNTKILYQEEVANRVYEQEIIPNYKNLAVYNEDFMKRMRQFLKSDEGSLQPALYAMKKHNNQSAVMNYMSNYNSFTMLDMISYNKKHNEDNGEGNQDGTPHNYSWNCGFEGKTKKKNIVEFRKKQYKNALALLFLSKGTPLLLAGDEFCNSQGGNNNPYCQDNAVTWLNWKELETNGEIFSYVQELIALRKEYKMICQDEVFKMTDYLSCGYPDLSYHSEAAWKLESDESKTYAGVLYSGNSSFLYIAYNMHWEKHELALPKLPADMTWKILLQTSQEKTTIEPKSILVAPRTVTVLCGIKKG
ncbi:MAG: alpha-amylase family glycosyl hydrolase [Eubacteriales bacterium]